MRVPKLGGNSKDPIAIVGIGCRFPGHANSPAAFWRLLCEGQDAISEVPPDRWLADAFYDPEPKPGRTPSRYGGFVDEIDRFDAHFFNISTREAAAIDPQQRLLLEVAWWALEDAGWPVERLAGSPTGVFVGISTHDYADLQCAPTERKGSANPYMCTGSALSIAANRISYVLDLQGPSLAVDTACSSSLVALHLACRSIWQGEAAQALVAGVNALLKPEMTLGFSQANMLSPTGRCRSFDAHADGYVRAEGAGCVALKPLSRAVRDGDRIYAVVRGSAMNQNGRTPGISLPSSSAQEAMLVQACADAGVDPRDIQYVEAHGTGTAAGDPIEATAIANVVGRDRLPGAECVLGSVKSNIGHLESGAGIAGLIKTALALHHRQIPRNLHFESPNPKVDFTGLRVPQSLEPWPGNRAGPRLAGVNSFGFGGSNAHVVLAGAPHASESSIATQDPDARISVLPLSARNDGALTALAASFAELLRRPSAPPLRDLCYSAGARRTHHSHRLAVVAGSTGEMAGALEAYLRQEPGDCTAVGRAAGRTPIVFVFAGMGPQWLGMGRELLAQETVFRQAVEACDRLFRAHSDISPLDELTAAEDRSRLDEDRVAQIALFTLQIGLVMLWKSWGIEPDAVVGHSAGEMAAAWAAGAMTLEDAVSVTFHRSRLQHRLRGQGRMLAVGLSPEHVHDLLQGRDGRVWLAAVNGPRSITLSGDGDALTEIAERLGHSGTFCRFLRGDIPYHSGLLDGSRDELLDVLSCLTPRPARMPLWSTVSGALVDGTDLSAEYWWNNIRRPVQFAAAVDGLMDAGHTTFVEIGPHPVLAPAIKECGATDGRDVTVLASLRRGECERTTVLAALGRLYTLGHAIDWTVLYPSGHLTALPNYPWQRQRHWRETESARLLRLGLTEWNECGQLSPTVHPLLGRRLTTAHAEAAWQVELDLPRTHSWIADHVIQGTIVYPAVGYLEMAVEAGAEGRVATDLEIHKPLALTRDTPQPLQLLVDRAQRVFTVHAQQPDGSWSRQASGRLGSPHDVSPPIEIDLAIVRGRLRRELSGEDLYKRYGQFGLQFGPLFRGIERIWMGPGESMARVHVVPELAPHLSQYNFHPAVLDACLQVFLAATFDRAAGLYLPVAVKRMQLHRALRELDRAAERPLWSHCKVNSRSSRQVTFDLTIYDDEGSALLELESLVCKAAGAGTEVELQLAEYGWELQARPGVDQAHTPAWKLPALEGLIETVRPALEPLATLRARSRHYREFPVAHQHLTLKYVVDAFRRLAWDFQPGDSVTAPLLADRLGVMAPFQRVVEQMLSVLADAGLARRAGETWEVLRVPEAHESAADAWRDCMTRLPAYLAEWTLMGAYGPHLAPILRGETDPAAVLPEGSPVWQHLFESSPLLRIYNEIVQRLVLALLERLPAERPVRVLGLAGSSGLATWLLPILPPHRTTYVSADAGPGSTTPPDERFVAYPFVQYRTLQLGDDPGPQGFAPHTFDVVLGARTLATLPDAPRALDNVRRLLAPGGLAVFVEPNIPFLSPVLGVVPGWCGTASRAACTDFERAGFASWDVLTDAASNEGPPSHSVIVAQAPPLNLAPDTHSDVADATGAWLVVAPRSSRAIADRLEAALVRLGGQVFVTPSAALNAAGTSAGATAGQSWRGIVYLAPDDRADRGDSRMSQETMTETCMEVVDLARSIPSASRARLWIVTTSAQPAAADGGGLNLAHAPLWGLGRVVANELPHLRCSRIDLTGAPASEELQALAGELAADGDDDEVALRGSDRYVHVLHPRAETSLSNGSFALRNETPGSLNGLALRRVGRRPPGPGEVEIEVHATGLNFKDVAIAMRLLSDSGLPSEVPLGLDPGLECAGRVSAIGPDVRGVGVGDDVLAFALNSFASHVVTDARFVLPRPAEMTAEEAATIPIVFLTAYHALHDLARVQPGERVLVHSATGGVGLAAVQLAQRLGAEVFATAGSPEKRTLLQSLGVRHVFNSRSLDFSAEILERTGGTGIDVVVNSLGGDFIARSLDLLRDGGRFVELGKRDLEQNTRLGLKPFNRQLAFFTIDLNRMAFTRPGLLERLQREVVALFERGELRVLPHRIFPITRVREAFRTMAKARHVGKLIVSMREPGVVGLPDGDERAPVRGDATYLLTGGLGGFGLATARWLVEQGAKHLVLIGRSGARRSEARIAIDTLRSGGVDVRVAHVDVSDAEALGAALADIRSTMPAVKGVIHGAMVLDDCTIAELTAPRLARVLAPKAQGAWNLHVLTRDDALDWFLLYSSVASTVGNPGQANYAAANAFLDLLAHHRRLLGLPALTVNWGAVADAGHLTDHDGIAQHLSRIGVRGVPVRQLLNALPELLVAAATQVSVHSLDWRRLSTFVPAMAKGSRLAAMRGASGTDDEALTTGDDKPVRELLLGMSVPERRVFIETIIKRELARLLGTAPEEIDTARPVTDLGVDSLMTVELGVALGRTLQMEVPTMTLLGGSSIVQFAATLCPVTDETAADSPVAVVTA